MRASGHYIRKRLRMARPARRLAILAILVLCAGTLVFRLGSIDFDALKAVLAVAFAMAALAFLVASAGLARVWSSGVRGGGVALGALVLSILALAPFALAGVLAVGNPAVSMASSDGMLANDIASGIAPEPAGEDAAAPVISGRRFQATAAQVFGVTRLVIGDLGWSVRAAAAVQPAAGEEGGDLGISGTVEIPIPTPRSSIDQDAANDPLNQPDSGDYTIEATATGPILALPSDVTIRIVEDGSETFVDMRSVSRVASLDLGQNRRFIEDFLARLETAMAGVRTIVPAEG